MGRKPSRSPPAVIDSLTITASSGTALATSDMSRAGDMGVSSKWAASRFWRAARAPSLAARSLSIRSVAAVRKPESADSSSAARRAASPARGSASIPTSTAKLNARRPGASSIWSTLVSSPKGESGSNQTSSKNEPPTSRTTSAPPSACWMPAWLSRHAGPEAGVALREVQALHQAFRVDPRANELGERHEFLLAAASCHAVSDHDRRPARPAQHFGHAGDRRLLRLRRPVEVAERPYQLRGLFLQYVQRQGDEHRSGGRIVRDLEGPVEDRRELVGAFDLDAPLDQRFGHCHQVVSEQGFAESGPGVLLPGGDDHRRVRLPGVVEHAEGVAEPWSHMQVDDSGDPGRLGVVVSGAQRHGFMQGEDVAQVRVVPEPVHQRTLGGAWIAEQERNAVLGQCLEQDVSAALGTVLGTDRWQTHGRGG